MSELIETIAAEIERPRSLSAQVVKHLDGTYGVDRDAIGPFFKDKLAALEDYEHDLILSPLFTPKLPDQSVFAELLGSASVPRGEWPSLIVELVHRPTRAHLVTSDGTTHTVILRDVTIERFVHRLRLDGAIPESLLKWIGQAPAADQPMLKAVARRAIWESDGRRQILLNFLTRTLAGGTYSISDVVDVLRLAEDYQPADSPALLARIPRWQKLLEEEIHAAFDPKPFFSSAVQQMHGGDDQRQKDESRTVAKRAELAFLQRLQHVLAEDAR